MHDTTHKIFCVLHLILHWTLMSVQAWKVCEHELHRISQDSKEAWQVGCEIHGHVNRFIPVIELFLWRARGPSRHHFIQHLPCLSMSPTVSRSALILCVMELPCMISRELRWLHYTAMHCITKRFLLADICPTPAKPSTPRDCTTSPGCAETTLTSWWPWAGYTRSLGGTKKWFLMTMKSRSDATVSRWDECFWVSSSMLDIIYSMTTSFLVPFDASIFSLFLPSILFLPCSFLLLFFPLIFASFFVIFFLPFVCCPVGLRTFYS